MLLDTQNLFSDDQAITTGTIYSTNTVKFGEGDISYLPLLIQVTKTFSDLTKLKVTLQTSETENFTNAQNLVESELALNDLKEGSVFPICHLPKGNLGYMRICYSVTGSTPETTGKITAGVVMSHDITYKA